MTSSDEVFKVFDTAERFAACILRETARVPLFSRSGKLPEKIEGIPVYNYFETNIGKCIKDAKAAGQEFCKNFKKDEETKDRGFYVKNFLKNKGFAAEKVGPLLYVSDSGLSPNTVMELDVSLSPFGGFQPTNVPLIVKSTAPRPVDASPIVYVRPQGSSEIFFKNKAGLVIDLEDPIHEVFTSSMLNIDYDGGFMPFLNKFYGYFICPDDRIPNGNTHNIITARSSFSLYDVLSKDSGISHMEDWVNNDMKSFNNLLMNIFAQFLYSVDYLKEKWNMRHFDMHLKNIMLNYVHDRKLAVSGQDPMKSDYQGKSLSDNVEWMVIQVDDKRIWLENTGVIVKLIDFGQTSFMVNSTEFTNREIDMFNKGENAHILTNENESAYNSMEVIMFLVNLYKIYIENSLDESDQQRNKPFVDFLFGMLDESVDWANRELFVNNLLNSIVTLTPEQIEGKEVYLDDSAQVISLKNYHTGKSVMYPDPKQTKIIVPGKGEYRQVNWFASRRDMVDLTNYESFGKWWEKFFEVLNGFGYYIDSENYFISLDGNAPDITKITPDKIIVLSKNEEGSRMSTGLRAYSDAWKSWNDICVRSPPKEADELISKSFPYESEEILKNNPSFSEKCLRIKTLYVDKNDPRALLDRKNVGDDIDIDSEYYDSAEGTFSLKTRNFFQENPPDFQNSDGSVKYWMVAVNPANIGLQKVSPDSAVNFAKYSYQRWVNYRAPRDTGDYINTVRIHAIKVDPTRTENEVDVGKTLWTSSMETPKNGYFTNGGYFVVGTNVNDPLAVTTSGERVSRDRIFTPIGFHYTEEKGAETYLDIPEGYKSFFYAVVFFDKEVMMVPYNDFLAVHQSEERSQIYQTKINATLNTSEDSGDYIEEFLKKNPGVVFEEKTRIISTSLDDSGIPRPVLADGTFAKYKAAFVTGPTLIENGRVKFTPEVMTAANFLDRNGSPYKVTFSAKNDKMFFSEEGEKNFPYGQRHSNFYITHNVMGQMDDGSVVFFLFEGRGFNAPGVDRSQLSAMVSNFGVKTLVSLDGGFSAQGIIKYGGASKMLLSDPDKRRVGIVMKFLTE